MTRNRSYVGKPYRKVAAVPYTEEYVVKFWMRKADGMMGQFKASYFFASKNRHEAAETACLLEYGIPKSSIVSVIYQ